MPGSSQDPYATLGVAPGISDAELRAAYRVLVKRHHPDHNGGSAESERRFEEIQAAYARVRELRAGGQRAAGTQRATGTSGTKASPSGQDPLGERLRAMEEELARTRAKREQEVRKARAARQRAAEAARRAAGAAAAEARSAPHGDARRATDEELGVYSTDDSFAKILADAREDIGALFGRALGAAERAAQEQARRAADRRSGRD